MRIGLKRTVAATALAFAIAAPTALAAGGVPGGGGTARPVCSGGGGANAGGCTTVTNATNFTLNAVIVPVYPFEVLSVKGNARYQVKDGVRTLVVGVKGLDPLDGQSLVLLVGNTWAANVTVSPTGTIDFSADSSRGDSVPDIGSLTEVILYHPDMIDRTGGGIFH